jgi:hypothetical protein
MEENKMNSAYKIAQELVRDRLKEQAPEFLDDLDAVQAADVIVTRGRFDHIETVLTQAGTPFTLVDPREIDRADLRPDQIVFVNCPGEFSEMGIRNLANFVEAGGFLFTTDWALKYVLERAFPGVVAYNHNKTRDDVVRVEVLDSDDPFLKTILGAEDDPQWWLEASSYPIKILDRERVNVLIKSRELGEKYGESPVFITFDHGEGKVYHMISHFYLQRSETRTERQKAPATNFVKEKGIKAEKIEKFVDMGAEKVPLADVESAYTSYGMTTRVLIEKMRREREKALRKEKGEDDEQ